MRRGRAPVVAGLVLGAAACGGGGNPDGQAAPPPSPVPVQGQQTAAASASPTPTGTASATPTGTAAASPTPTGTASASATPAAQGEPTPTTCDDPTGDSSGALDLTEAGLVVGSEQVVASFAWTGSVPTTGAAAWIVTAASADGDETRQLGYEVVGGAESGHFVYDVGTDERVGSDGVAVLDERQLTASFPAAAVEELGEDWTWRATLTIAGAEVDACEPT